MKNRALLIVTFFLIFCRTSLGDESSNESYFSNYVNSSPKDQAVSPIVDKNVKPTHAKNDEHGKNSDEKDTGPVLQGIPAKWRACTMDSDCTAGVLDCVSWDALNKKHLKELSKNLRSCSASIDPGFQPEAACVHKACQITGKITDVSWEEWYNKIRS